MFTPKTKALVGTVGFSLAGLISLVGIVSDLQSALPLIVFYITLLINTYFSIKLFASITPKENKTQLFFDLLLAGIYVLLALHLHYPQMFVYLALLLFIVATAKYTFMLNVVHHPKLLKRKILVDLLGTVTCACTLGGILAGYTLMSTWIFSLLFIAANLFLFFIKPLYKADHHETSGIGSATDSSFL